MADQGNDPRSLTTRRAYDLLAKGFGPGSNGPVLLAADFTGKTNRDSVTAFAATLRNDPDVALVAPVNVNAAGNATVVPVIPKSAPQDRSTEQLVHRLRSEIKQRGLAMHVGSVTAIAIDALIVRTILVPAVMHALGKANWYLPAWLDRFLPHIAIDEAGATGDSALTEKPIRNPA